MPEPLPEFEGEELLAKNAVELRAREAGRVLVRTEEDMLDVGRGREQFVGMSGHQTAEFPRKTAGIQFEPSGMRSPYTSEPKRDTRSFDPSTPNGLCRHAHGSWPFRSLGLPVEGTSGRRDIPHFFELSPLRAPLHSQADLSVKLAWLSIPS
jgi:hypothetical protein